MEYLLRVGASKPDYPNITHIFAIKHYKPKEEGDDEFSKRLIYFYKFGNNLDYFLESLINLYNLRFYGDSIIFDYVTLYPTRKKGEVNPCMAELIKKFSEKTGIPYRQVLRRNRDIRPNHELRTFKERKENVQGSLDVTDDVAKRNIIIFDNTSTTGISLIDAANLLKENGADHVACICLGLGYKEREKDWSDLNKTLKYSRIIDICKSTFIKKEEIEKWRKKP